MKRAYSLATEKLIDRICLNVEREDYILQKRKGEDLLLQTYDIFGLQRPKSIVWCVDIYDKRFDDAAWSASSARSAWSARSASSALSARSAWSASSARSAWSASSARSAWSARSALDYDYDWFVLEHEYVKNRKGNPGEEPNVNDIAYLRYSNLLLRASECGVGFWAEKDGVLYLVPDCLKRIDSQNRFHNEAGPAIWWKGGKAFYYIHGVQVSEKVVRHPEQLTKRDWQKENNLEVRRIIQDRMPDFAKKIGGKKIQKDERGELYEIDLKDDPEKIARYVKVKDSSTSRVYWLRVPPTTTTASDGVAWSFGLTKEAYSPKEEA